MSKGKNFNGGEFSSQILKIHLGEDYSLRYKPNLPSTDPAFVKNLFSKVELLVKKVPVSDNPIYSDFKSFPGIQIGSELLFTINIPTGLDADQNRALTGIYFAMVAEVDKETVGTEIVSTIAQIIHDFSFQIIDSGADRSFNNMFYALDGIPHSLEGLKDIKVSLKLGDKKGTQDLELWDFIRNTTQAISFNNYSTFINSICGIDDPNSNELVKSSNGLLKNLTRRRFLPFNDTDSYRTIKVLTEFFLLVNCPVDPQQLPSYAETLPGELDKNGNTLSVIPYMNIIRQKLSDLAIKPRDIGDVLNLFLDEPIPGRNNGSCYGILREKLASPCLIELIWSYWHEEAMLVQSMNAISLRFQNRKQPGKAKDPLSNMAIAPLLPLNNLMWGYVQDEQHRLSVLRRAYEYDHHYGITLQGKAVPNVEGADSRSNFLEAFHALLYRCTIYFKQVDDLTVKADGFPILNALREVHFILSEGMHNQYGDLPWVARVEMLMQQWMLARPEFREFLPSRTMVAYPEPWMGPLSTMNNMQGWTGNSPINFNSLAVYGEALLLSVRFGNWNDPSLDADNAANWADFWRNEIQGYIHAYRTLTGVDLGIPHPQTGKIDAQQPALHLLRRAKAGSNGNGHINASANGKSTVY